MSLKSDERPCLVIVPDLSSSGMVRRLLRSEMRAGWAVYGCSEDFTFGPLWADMNAIELLRRRYRYWRAFGIVENFSRGRRLQDILPSVDRAEIWLGAEEREQILLIWFVAYLEDFGFGELPLIVRQYDVDKSGLRALAVLRSEELEHRPEPVEISSALRKEVAVLWRAVASDSPERLIAACKAEVAVKGLPFLAEALMSMVLRYPERTSGLSVGDRALLHAAAVDTGSLKAARVIADAMHDLYDQGHRHGDIILFHMLIGLTRGPKPPLELVGIGKDMRHTEVRLTEFGRACLAGDANQIETNGIDRWVGGVHLNTMTGDVWFRNGTELMG